MARNLFGGTASDVAEDVTGARVPGAVGTVWDGPSAGANQITDLTDIDGVPKSQLVADTRGFVASFFGPDGLETLWVDFGAGKVAITSVTIGERFDTHLTDPDPHGDRAYADGKFVPKAGGPVGTITADGVQVGSPTTDFGGGVGVVGMTNAGTIPNANPANGAVMYAQGGTIKARSSSGVISDFSTFARNEPGYFVPPGWGQFWRAKRNAAKAGTGLATVAAVGSSSTQGLYSSNLVTSSFVGKLTNGLQSSFGDGGSGFFGSGRSSQFLGASASTTAWAGIPGNLTTNTGTWSIGNPYGPGANYLFTQTNGDTISFLVRGTRIRIYTLGGAGRVNFTYSIDGGTAVAVTDSGAGVSTVQVTSVTASVGQHQVTLRHNGTNGSSFAVCGVTGENTTGVVVNNYGLSGAGSGTFTDVAPQYGPAQWSGGPDYPADLVVYALGANDAFAGLAGDAWATNLRMFLQTAKDGSTLAGAKATGNTDVLILMQHIGQYDTTHWKWQDYSARVRGIAHAYGAAVVDLWTLGRNSWNYWNSLGHWGNSATVGIAGTDVIHMSDAGHLFTANTLLPILSA
ncbi:SGNH/GDSL hydrolase family protein [Streptomyces sp. NPDC048489]|uniref:SGNH/GDSL hydrolase family protein n=1 Tax=Streptomyces sp. NPDC048489 TaxID=3154504 RepID=UPI00343C0D55